jgi:20S proteasome subunit alpha 5
LSPYFLCRYHVDPSGTWTKYEAKAIGAGSEGAQTALEEKYNKVTRHLFALLCTFCASPHFAEFVGCLVLAFSSSCCDMLSYISLICVFHFVLQSMKLHEAQTVALEVLRQVMEEKLNATNVEVAVVSSATGKFSLLKKDQWRPSLRLSRLMICHWLVLLARVLALLNSPHCLTL